MDFQQQFAGRVAQTGEGQSQQGGCQQCRVHVEAEPLFLGIGQLFVLPAADRFEGSVSPHQEGHGTDDVGGGTQVFQCVEQLAEGHAARPVGETLETGGGLGVDVGDKLNERLQLGAHIHEQFAGIT